MYPANTEPSLEELLTDPVKSVGLNLASARYSARSAAGIAGDGI